jgi:hypothetical protein
MMALPVYGRSDSEAAEVSRHSAVEKRDYIQRFLPITSDRTSDAATDQVGRGEGDVVHVPTTGRAVQTCPIRRAMSDEFGHSELVIIGW